MPTGSRVDEPPASRADPRDAVSGPVDAASGHRSLAAAGIVDAMERYWRFAQDLFAPLGPDDGIPEDVVADAEREADYLVQDYLDAEAEQGRDVGDAGAQRFRLPAALREVYLRSGRRKDMHCQQDCLLGPDLEIEDGYLLIYQEEQAVCSWGIHVRDLAVADPPVHVSYQGASTWHRDHDQLSEFLLTSLFWQRVHCEPWRMLQIEPDRLAEATAGWELVPFPGAQRMDERGTVRCRAAASGSSGPSCTSDVVPGPEEHP
jgi:hypothetical protein